MFFFAPINHCASSNPVRLIHFDDMTKPDAPARLEHKIVIKTTFAPP